MNVGSLFTGIGGFDLGLERAGMRVAWQCEADDFCRRVLAHRWPGVPCYPDVRELHGANVEPVDVLCGGFPCQDISLAGKGAGIDGARSGLWGEYARLVGELRPRYVVVENVSALLARGLGRVVGDLAALGYDAEWDCIPASAVGAPHRRDRLWLVAYPQCQGELQPGGALGEVRGRLGNGCESVAYTEGIDEPREPGRDHEGRPLGGAELGAGRGVEPRDSAARGRVSGRDPVSGGAGAVADANEERRVGRPRKLGTGGRPESADGGSGELQDADGVSVQPWRVGGRAAQAGGSEWWAVEPPVGRVAHGVPGRLAQLAALGNALVPQIAEWLGSRIVEWEGGLT